MPEITTYTGTQLKKDFMSISDPEEYMDWREKYPEYVGEEFDDEMNKKFDEILRMVQGHPLDRPNCHIELWKKA